jgi:hypothetical protein
MKKITGAQVLTWIQKNIPDHKIRKGGQEVVIANPWGDSGKHFNISLVEKKAKSGRSGFWVHDWRPGHQQHDGSFLKFVQDFRGCTFFDALKEVCGRDIDPRAYLRSAKETQETASEIPQETEISLPAGAKRIDIAADTLARVSALNYLQSRAISPQEAKQYYIHYDSVSIIFPYVEFGVVVYWQSRSMVGKTFEFPPDSVGVTKSQFLYGFDHVEPGDQIILCEAIIDAINIGPGAMAIGGANLSEAQIRKLKILGPSSIILAADNDKPDRHGIRPGVSSISHNYNLLKPYFKDIFFSIPSDPHKDWNDVKVAGADPSNIIEATKKRASLRSIVSLRNIV